VPGAGGNPVNGEYFWRTYSSTADSHHMMCIAFRVQGTVVNFGRGVLSSSALLLNLMNLGRQARRGPPFDADESAVSCRVAACLRKLRGRCSSS